MEKTMMNEVHNTQKSRQGLLLSLCSSEGELQRPMSFALRPCLHAAPSSDLSL